MKYYIKRESKATKRIEYKLYKCIDGWTSESNINKCWKFSKQGALKIIERQSDRNWHYNYSIVEAPDDSI